MGFLNTGRGEGETGMSEGKRPRTEEQRRIDRRSFYIGIGIGIAIMALYVILYFAGYIK
jgi:hypothetical protein